MSRNIITEGIILRTGKIGEIHKSLSLYTPDRGLLNVIAHGAWKSKSKLRASSQLFSYARFYIYHQPVKNSYKVSDIQTLELYEGLRENIKKYYTASLWGEVIFKSFGGGEGSPGLFRLLKESMDLLCAMDEGTIDYMIIQFLWRFLRETGYQPDLTFCGHCNKNVDPGVPLFYQASELYFVCGYCRTDRDILVNPGIRKYLNHTGDLPLSAALAIKIGQESTVTIKRIIYGILENLLEYRLKSLQSGKGIL